MGKVLLTGSAGFIGFHLAKALIKKDYHVIGIDNLNNYYDSDLKLSRLSNIENLVRTLDASDRYVFKEQDITNSISLSEIFKQYEFDIVINLAAQAGVRYSLENPMSYINSNIIGFTNILECCRQNSIKHLLFASSSSVYGMNNKQPFSVKDNTDYPVSLYAATKKANELLAFSYSHLFKIPSTGLRFFTVYGPYGRPDMAYYSFTKSIINNEKIDLYNAGNMKRDFTYIDDIVEGILKIIPEVPENVSQDSTNAEAPYRVFNIGNNNPVTLNLFIKAIEDALGMKARKNLLPMQAGDVPITYADIDPLCDLLDFKPKTTIDTGIKEFVDWYLQENSK